MTEEERKERFKESIIQKCESIIQIGTKYDDNDYDHSPSFAADMAQRTMNAVHAGNLEEAGACYGLAEYETAKLTSEKDTLGLIEVILQLVSGKTQENGLNFENLLKLYVDPEKHAEHFKALHAIIGMAKEAPDALKLSHEFETLFDRERLARINAEKERDALDRALEFKIQQNLQLKGQKQYKQLTQEEALTILDQNNIKITKRTLQNWIKGKPQLPGFPGLSDSVAFSQWAAAYDKQEKRTVSLINMSNDDLERKAAKYRNK